MVLDHYTVHIRGDSSFGEVFLGGSRITLNRGIFDAIVRYILLSVSVDRYIHDQVQSEDSACSPHQI
jgi:hypothetical protein